MNRVPFAAPTPWLFLQCVGLVEPKTIVATDEYGREVHDAPPPLAVYLVGAFIDPVTGHTANMILGVVGTPEHAGQVIDAIRASAESRGAAPALTAAVDQAQAARTAPARRPIEYPACAHRPDRDRIYLDPCADCPEGTIL